MARKKKIKMGDYTPTDKEVEAYIWGVNNNLRIAPKPLTKGLHPDQWYVEIFLNGKWVHSKETFGVDEVFQQVFNYYVHYYEKKQGSKTDKEA